MPRFFVYGHLTVVLLTVANSYSKDYKGQKPRFQGLKSYILICFGLIIQILVFYGRLTAFRAKLQYTFVELKCLLAKRTISFLFAAHKRHQQIKNLFACSVLTSLLNAPRVIG